MAKEKQEGKEGKGVRKEMKEEEKSVLVRFIEVVEGILNNPETKIKNEMKALEEAIKGRDMAEARKLLPFLQKIVMTYLEQFVKTIDDKGDKFKLGDCGRLVLGQLYEKVFGIAGLSSEWDVKVDPLVVEVFKDETLWERLHGWGEDWGQQESGDQYENVVKYRREWLAHHKFLQEGIRLYQKYYFRLIINFEEKASSAGKEKAFSEICKGVVPAIGKPKREVNFLTEAQEKLMKAKEFFNSNPKSSFSNRCRLYGMLMSEASKFDIEILQELDEQEQDQQNGNQQGKRPKTASILVQKLILLDKSIMNRMKFKDRCIPFVEQEKAVIDHLVVHAAQQNHYELIQWVLDNHEYVMGVPQEAWADALWVAAHENNGEVVRVLLGNDRWKHLKVNFQNGKTNPLHLATKLNHLYVVQLLCGDGSPCIPGYLRDEQKKTARDLAFSKEHLQDIEAILLRMPDVACATERLYRDRQVYVDAANVMLVGAALIASVTFCGWLQPPLGYSDYYQFPEPYSAPPGTYQSYMSFQGHLAIQIFAVFNSISFFFAIATVLAGADATFPVADTACTSTDSHNVRRIEVSLERLHSCVKLTTILFVISNVCGLGAFASAGFAILPPSKNYNWIMIFTVSVGGCVCMVVLAKFVLRGNSKISDKVLQLFKYHPRGGSKDAPTLLYT